MILCEYFYPNRDLTWDYAKCCGVEHAVMRLPETPDFDIGNIAHWQTVVDRLKGFGMTPLVLEPMPNCVHDHIKLGDEKRDESIEKVVQMLGVMDRLDIRLICFNFMAIIGWLRTSSDLLDRGGATVTGFDIADLAEDNRKITQAQLWRNYWYFMDAVLPYAEKHGIVLALHPDDPPISPLHEVERIMISYENIRKAIFTHISPSLGLTFCQAVYRLMGEDLFALVPQIQNDIRFIHFRNVTGDKYHFRETFHDQGEIPMGRLMELYYDLNIHVPIRPDHVPHLPGEGAANAPGYGAAGKLFALGYMKGLMENAAQKQRMSFA